ncbi:hypothetical protein LINGRAPRIM_LOCUS2142 [Linum grandiflorum]
MMKRRIRAVKVLTQVLKGLPSAHSSSFQAAEMLSPDLLEQDSPAHHSPLVQSQQMGLHSLIVLVLYLDRKVTNHLLGLASPLQMEVLHFSTLQDLQRVKEEAAAFHLCQRFQLRREKRMKGQFSLLIQYCSSSSTVHGKNVGKEK